MIDEWYVVRLRSGEAGGMIYNIRVPLEKGNMYKRQTVTIKQPGHIGESRVVLMAKVQ